MNRAVALLLFVLSTDIAESKRIKVTATQHAAARQNTHNHMHTTASRTGVSVADDSVVPPPPAQAEAPHVSQRAARGYHAHTTLHLTEKRPVGGEPAHSDVHLTNDRKGLAASLSVSGQKEHMNSSVDHELKANTFALLEQYSLSALKPTFKNFGMVPVGILMVAFFLMLVGYMSVHRSSGGGATDNAVSERSQEKTFEELVKRLSKTVKRPPLGDVIRQATMRSDSLNPNKKKREEEGQGQISIWWGTHSHTWASTRLGWWESHWDHVKRREPVSSIFLKDVSEVKTIISDAHEPDEPAVSITLTSPNGHKDKVILYLATAEVCSNYVEDLKMMISKVKAADAIEKSRSSQPNMAA